MRKIFDFLTLLLAALGFFMVEVAFSTILVFVAVAFVATLVAANVTFGIIIGLIAAIATAIKIIFNHGQP